ncbi:MAG: serine protease inhibitor [Prochlorococcus sp.]
MACSCLRLSAISRPMLPRQASCRPVVGQQVGWAVRAVVAVIVLMSAMVLAPERPELQASICERHNPVSACQVW